MWFDCLSLTFPQYQLIGNRSALIFNSQSFFRFCPTVGGSSSRLTGDLLSVVNRAMLLWYSATVVQWYSASVILTVLGTGGSVISQVSCCVTTTGFTNYDGRPCRRRRRRKRFHNYVMILWRLMKTKNSFILLASLWDTTLGERLRETKWWVRHENVWISVNFGCPFFSVLLFLMHINFLSLLFVLGYVTKMVEQFRFLSMRLRTRVAFVSVSLLS